MFDISGTDPFIPAMRDRNNRNCDSINMRTQTYRLLEKRYHRGGWDQRSR